MNLVEKFIGFDKIKETTFLKDFNRDNENLKKLSKLHNICRDNKTKKLIEKDMSLIRRGLEGENYVYFELKNSLLPMICMHDVRIEVDGLFAQIDFLAITNKFIYILETKHLVGDIRINSNGDFIRIIRDKSNRIIKEEGMYNPVTQGDRHARLLTKFLEKKNLVINQSLPVKSIAVLANPKTVLNKDYAPEHIKNNIYRYDQIVYFLQKEFLNKEYDTMISDSKLDYIAKTILKEHTPICYDYESKYGIKISDYTNIRPANTTNSDSNKKNYTITFDYIDIRNHIEEELRTLRKTKSRELDIKAYELFTNKQLELLLNHMPKTLIDLNKLNIVPKKGAALIGKDIVGIINKYHSPDNNNYITKDSKEYLHLKNNLIEYRNEKAKSLNIQEYMVLTNAQIEELLITKPKNTQELYTLKGFNAKQIINYGKELIFLLNNKKALTNVSGVENIINLICCSNFNN